MFLLLNNLIVIFKINVIIKEFNRIKHIFRVIKTFNNEIVNNEIFI